MIFMACSSNITEPIQANLNLFSNNQYLKSGTTIIGFNVAEVRNTHDTRANHSNKPSLYALNFSSDIDVVAPLLCENLDDLSTLFDASPLVKKNTHTKNKSDQQFAPLVGFFPLSIQFKPADNEVWLQIVREKNQLEVYKGKEIIKVIPVEGEIKLASGEYPLQHKQRNPLWYAPDEYFSKRELRIPPRGDHFRYRRGALGNYALYPTMDFVIHSGPFWSEEVGGLKVSESDLASIFVMLNVGTPILVK